MRQPVIPDAVLGIEPFAIQDVAVFQARQQTGLLGRGKALEEIELALAIAAMEVVPPRLQQQFAAGGEGDAGIGAIEFFLDHDVAVGQGRQGCLVVVGVAVLQTAASEVGRAGIAQQRQ